MKISVKMDGLQAAINRLNNTPKKAAETVQKHMEAFALHTVNEAVRRVPVDEGALKNAIKPKIGDLQVEVIVASNYAAYVEFGTKKFAAKYVASLPQDWQEYAATFKGKGGGSSDDLLLSIMEWVKRKGFAAHRTASGNRSKSKSSQEAQENAAYIIALRILQNGTRAHPYLYPAFEITKKELLDNLKKDFGGNISIT